MEGTVIDTVEKAFDVIKNYYVIFYDPPPLYSIKPAEFFELEGKIFNLKKRIDDLNIIIVSLLETLNSIDFSDKKLIIEQVQKKQELAKSYQIKYKTIYDDYANNFSYYIQVFKFYESKYYEGKSKKKKILKIIVSIQELIRDNLFAFYNQYSLLKKHYEETNEYILKVKGELKKYIK